MRFFELLMWFREFQRLLLDVRGWIIWFSDVRPRLLDPDFRQPFPILPIRGVFTSNVTVVSELFRVGVPVWYIRDRNSLTTSVFLNRVKTSIASLRCFSQTSGRSAPHFHEGPSAAIYSSTELKAVLHKHSMLQRPLMRSAKEWDPTHIDDETSALPSEVTVVEHQSLQQYNHGTLPSV